LNDGDGRLIGGRDRWRRRGASSDNGGRGAFDLSLYYALAGGVERDLAERSAYWARQTQTAGWI
jgi:hypothetical protein